MNWKDIKEEKPKDGQIVLVWNELHRQVTIQMWNSDYQCWDTWDMEDCPYWMELPEEPTHISK